MGCASSKPSSHADASPYAAAPPEKSSHAASSTATQPARLAPSSSRQSGVRAPSKVPYDTVSSASLVEGSTSTVAYHGLLANSGKLNLSRTPTLGTSKVFAKDKHPNHDSNAAAVAELEGQCTRVTGVAMTMPYTIVVGKPASGQTVEDIAGRVFDNANNLLNGWNLGSEISKLNRAKPGKTVPLSPSLAKLFDIIDDVHELSEARFDPTTGVLTVAFENCITENGRPPLPAEIAPFQHAIGWKKRLQRGKGGISRGNGNTVIDLDGLSKGYVIDLIVEALTRQGFTDCYVDWSGDIRATGKHPSGRPWRSAVMKPPGLPRVFGHWKDGTMKEMLSEEDIGLMATFGFAEGRESGERTGGAIATSGDYFAVQKYGYHHIARPDTLTLMKANPNSVGSVCVAAKTCAFADALATAAMTFDNPAKAANFLQRVCAERPEQVYGFCVLGRKTNFEDTKHTITSSIFEPISSSDERSSSDISQESVQTDERSAEKHMKSVLNCIIRNRYEVTFNGKSMQSDNFVPCSMKPEQIVTLVLPNSFIEGASLIDGDTSNKFSCKVLSPLSQTEPEKSRDTGLKADLLFRHITRLNNSALVTAAIRQIVLLDVDQSIEVVFRETFIPSQKVSLGVPRSKVPFLPLAEQAKLLFRQVPSMMWIVTTTSADSSNFAFTATSPVAPASAPGILSFNISHSSAFYAAFGGIGSIVHMHALSTTQKGLADRYVKNSALSQSDSTRLERESMLTAHCYVEHVDSFQDHLLVLAKIETMQAPNDFGALPLAWQNGAFLN